MNCRTSSNKRPVAKRRGTCWKEDAYSRVATVAEA